MADIQIVKYKLRRGTDQQRKLVLLDEGEIVYTTDTKRIFVGTGVLTGGNVVGSKIHSPLTNTYSLTTINAQVGDMVQAKNVFYQLTAADYSDINAWKNVGPKLDTQILNYDSNNNITITNNSISAVKLDSSSVTDGVKIDGGYLKTDLNTTSLEISSNQISVKEEGIGARELASSAFSGGLVGGGGSTVTVNVDPDFFYIKTGNLLSLSALPDNSLTFSGIDQTWVGDGLVYNSGDSQIDAVVTGVDSSLTKALDGTIGLQTGLASATNELPFISTDTYGRVFTNSSSIYDTVSSLSATNGGALSAIFNGTPNQALSGAISGIPLTTFTVLSSNSGGTLALELSSAGFIMFEGGALARQDGKYIGRFAIPIFSY